MSYFLTPIISIMKYLKYNTLQTIEMILIGAKTELTVNNIINKLKLYTKS